MAVLPTATLRLFLKESKSRGKPWYTGQGVLYTFAKNSFSAPGVQAALYSCYLSRITGPLKT